MSKSHRSIAKRSTLWQESLRKIQSEPLQYCPSFPEIAQRWNSWWKFESDRPLIIAQAPKRTDFHWDRCLDLLEQPQEWLHTRFTQVEQSHFAGEALPFIRVDIGPVAMAAFLGAPLHFAQEEDTSWQEPVIKSWQGPIQLEIDPQNKWLQIVLSLMDLVIQEARGKFLVCTPDLTGAIDVLMNMRGMQQLCLDLFDYREKIMSIAAQEVDAWEQVFSQMYDLILGNGVGITHWVQCWADSPFTVSACDFNALISQQDFKEICIPSISEQSRRAGLSIFHLDGPDAARHAKILAEDPDITAVQYTPGAGTPSPLEKLPMFHMFQQHNTPLFIDCPVEEVKQLLSYLDPRGVAIRVNGLRTPDQADDLIAWREAEFA